MNLDYKTIQKTTYFILIALFLFIIVYCFTFNSGVVRYLSFRQKTNLNSLHSLFN